MPSNNDGDQVPPRPNFELRAERVERISGAGKLRLFPRDIAFITAVGFIVVMFGGYFAYVSTNLFKRSDYTHYFQKLNISIGDFDEAQKLQTRSDNASVRLRPRGAVFLVEASN